MMDLAAFLSKRGVYLHQIADLVYQLQKPYSPHLTLESCLSVVEGIIKKREVQYTVLTGGTLDILAEEKKLPEPLLQSVIKDEPLYGVDEVLGLGIANIYGTIGTTSFGYLDKGKYGIIGDLNNNKNNKVNTFMDDLVAGIAAAGSAKIAHNSK